MVKALSGSNYEILSITKDGKEYNMVQHSGSGFRYLADAKAVSNLESSDLNESMDALAAEEGF